MVKISSYIAFLDLYKKCFTFYLPVKPVNLKTNSRGRIKSGCHYYTKAIHSHIKPTSSCL